MKTFITVDWGDHLDCSGQPYGPKQIEALMRRIAEAGLAGVLWRTDGCGCLYYRGREVRRLDQTVCRTRDQAAATFAECDPLATAAEMAHRHGLAIFSWTTLWDSWRQGFDEDGKVTADYTDTFFEGRPEYWLLSRDGGKFCEGVPCYAVDEVVEHRLAQIREINAYDLDGIYLCSRSHSRSGWTPREDYFGYNEPIVAEYRRRFGIDIREQDFCRDAWRRVHGEFITEFFRKIRDVTAGRTLWAGISPNNNWLLAQNMYPSHPFSCTVHKDWIRWLREGILDGLTLALSRFEPHDMAELEDYKTLARATGRTVSVWRNLVVRLDRAGSDAGGTELICPDVLRRRQEEMDRAGLDAAIWHEAADLEFGGTTGDQTAPAGGFERFSSHWNALSGS